jgi:hypothetical protein
VSAWSCVCTRARVASLSPRPGPPITLYACVRASECGRVRR